MAVCVYRAGSIVDAQFVLDELKAAALDAHISGSYLSGAIGELPPDQLISVWIKSAAHEDLALQIVREFEQHQRLEAADQPCHQCGEMLAPQFGRCWNCAAWQPVR